MQLLGIFEIGGLFALHGKHDDLVNQGEFVEVGFFVAFLFRKFESLGQEILIHRFLNFVSVFFLIVNPASKLVGIFSGILREFGNLLHCLGDGALVGVEILEDGIVRINSTGDLAVCLKLGRGGKRKKGGCSGNGVYFHNSRKLLSEL